MTPNSIESSESAPKPRSPSNRSRSSRPASWLERLRQTLGLGATSVPRSPNVNHGASAANLAKALLSERGEASGAVIARELHDMLRGLDDNARIDFYKFLASEFQPAPDQLRAAAETYIARPTPEAAADLALAADPPRQEVLRRMNMAAGGTSALVAMRKEIAGHLRGEPALKPLDADLKHLFASWFNRGFLELRRIDWQSPAAVLEKLIAYEAVHEIHGWDDLRRRLAPDRRCFAFFHPALPGEPLIFVEVALVRGLAGAVQPLLVQETDNEAANDAARLRASQADTAIFYSISNCQDGLRGISFGNFLIKQVVAELKSELPSLTQFSTLSPVPGFRRWLAKRAASSSDPEVTMLAEIHADAGWADTSGADVLRPAIMRLCAEYLTRKSSKDAPSDPVARFHLGNGARLERINWLGNIAPRGIEESFGVMVNYLYDLETIESNHEAFVHDGEVVHSAEVDAWLHDGRHAARKRKRETPERIDPA
jgi:malonyl-CoA decarboxylase